MHRGEMQYTTPKAAEILGVTPARLISWCEKGLVIPELGDVAGPRSKRLLSFKNLIELGLVSVLSDKGIHTHTIKKLMQAIQKYDSFARLYTSYAFEEGMDGLGGGSGPKSAVRVKDDGSEVEVTHERGPDHVGSLWWIEGQTPVVQQNTKGNLEVVSYETTLLPYVTNQPPLAVKLDFLLRMYKTADMILGVDLGDIEARIYQATPEA